MEKLLDAGDNQLTQIKSTDTITVGLVIKKTKQQADALSISTGKPISPLITTHAETQEEADQLNVINQSVIGAKEDAVEAITKLVGSNINDAILCMADGSDHKSIDDYMLFEVMQVSHRWS